LGFIVSAGYEGEPSRTFTTIYKLTANNVKTNQTKEPAPKVPRKIYKKNDFHIKIT